MARGEMVTLQLFRDGRPVGRPVSAHLDWRADGDELRTYLLDAMARAHYRARRVGEFELEVRRATTNRYLTTFVATGEAR
ncbi:MAG: hypothetical protein ACRDRZ_13115 [Pseudonocardiaceae bacterium]